VFVDTFIMDFWNPTISSTSEHIFDMCMVEIKYTCEHCSSVNVQRLLKYLEDKRLATNMGMCF